MRRELGQGRWDKILMKRMLALSVSDDYTVARDEWIATGDVWWSGSYSVPDWVQNSTHLTIVCAVMVSFTISVSVTLRMV